MRCNIIFEINNLSAIDSIALNIRLQDAEPTNRIFIPIKYTYTSKQYRTVKMVEDIMSRTE